MRCHNILSTDAPLFNPNKEKKNQKQSNKQQQQQERNTVLFQTPSPKLRSVVINCAHPIKTMIIDMVPPYYLFGGILEPHASIQMHTEVPPSCNLSNNPTFDLCSFQKTKRGARKGSLSELSITTRPSSSVEAPELFHVSLFTEQVDSSRRRPVYQQTWVECSRSRTLFATVRAVRGGMCSVFTASFRLSKLNLSRLLLLICQPTSLAS